MSNTEGGAEWDPDAPGNAPAASSGSGHCATCIFLCNEQTKLYNLQSSVHLLASIAVAV